MKSLRRRFDGKISEGQWSQLLWVFFFIGLTFILFLILSRVLFGPDSFGWQDIIALYLDPGVFGGEGKYDIFRLLVTLVGALLFTAVLISIVSNIFENISKSYKKGESRYKFNHHILIMGSSKVLPGMLSAIAEDKDNKYYNKQIVIMANRPIEPLRDEITAFLNEDKILNRITFYYDRRDNKINLEKANAGFADYIFVIGEDNEPYHDFISLQCLKYLREIIMQQKTVKRRKSSDISGSPLKPNCFVIMGSQSTMKSYQLVGTDVKDKNGNPTFVDNPKNSTSFNESVLNINECKAEVFLKNIQPIITESTKRNTNNEISNVFFTIYGMTSFSRALASTIAYSFHFKNTGCRTIITIIDDDLKNKIRNFQMRYNVLFHYCDCNYNVYDIDAIVESAGINDICWNFIEDIPSSNKVFDYLKSIQKKQNDGEAIGITTICYEDISRNLATEVSLREKLGGINVYADFAEYDDALSLQPSTRTSLKVTSKGLNFKIKESFKYIFCERQEVGQKYYKEYECRDIDWSKLPFADKQKYIYLGFALYLWQEGNDSNLKLNIEKVREFTNFLMGRSKNKDGKSFYYFEDSHYMKAIYKHFHYDGPHSYKENVDNISDTKEDCKKVQSLYIEALKNGREYDLPDFIKFEVWLSNDSNLQELIVLSEELFQAISDYSKKFGLSSNCIDALLQLIKNSVIPYFAKNKSCIIISELAKNGSGYACLAMSSLCNSDEYQEMVKWYKEAVRFPDFEIPDHYFENITDDKVKQLYKDTESCFCLNWIIRKGLPELNSLNYDKDYIGTLENTVAKLTNLSGAELYWRIASALHSKPCYQGMWLKKAESAAHRDNNDKLLYHIYLAFGDYFEYRHSSISGNYYKSAYELRNDGEEAIQKYGRCLYWGRCNVNKDRETALKIGYKLEDESADFIQQCKEEEEWIRQQENKEEELRNSIQYEVDWEYYKKEFRKVKDRITEWEIKFPDIEHPYQRVLDELPHFYNDEEIVC